jgi:NAD+ synthase (glutamine-hydrolysing)
MKIAIAQLNYHIGNFDLAFENITSEIKKAKSNLVDLIVFSELAICGYPPHDLLEQKDFIDHSIDTINRIALECDSIAAILGGPSLNTKSRGKRLFNSAYFLNNGKVEKLFHKTLLPTYDVFDEYRYFEPNDSFEILEFKGHKIAITICEDLWDKQPTNISFAKEKIYQKVPLEELSKQNPEFVINISASPFSYNQEKNREQILIRNAQKYNVPIIYANQVGAQTELIFDGASLLISAEGTIIQKLKIFEEDYFEFDHETLFSSKFVEDQEINKIQRIHDALILGIRDYFHKTGFTKATLGLSGGIDSAVTVVLAARALGNENIRVLLMPSKYSSDHSVNDAVDLANNLDIQYDIVKIHHMVESFNAGLDDIFKDCKEDIAEENIQARIRGTLMMALSNKFGHILLNTSNKSEAAVGYGTLYGDMNGGLSVLGDVYKTDVFALARYINNEKEIIPENTITKPPSAELKPDQVDQDSLPEYDLLDSILFEYIELKKSESEIVDLGYDEKLVKRVIRLVNMNEYKRFQTPPILRVSSKAFGFGRRMPLVAKY